MACERRAEEQKHNFERLRQHSHFNEILVFQRVIGLTGHGGEVANAVVDGDTRRERDALLQFLLLLKHFVGFLQDALIAVLADFPDRRSRHTFIYDLLQHPCKISTPTATSSTQMREIRSERPETAGKEIGFLADGMVSRNR